MLTDFICCFQLFNRRKAALKHAMQLFSTRLTLIGHLIAALYLPQNLILAKHHGMISGSNLKQITGSSHACFQKQRNSLSGSRQKQLPYLIQLFLLFIYEIQLAAVAGG